MRFVSTNGVVEAVDGVEEFFKLLVTVRRASAQQKRLQRSAIVAEKKPQLRQGEPRPSDLNTRADMIFTAAGRLSQPGRQNGQMLDSAGSHHVKFDKGGEMIRVIGIKLDGALQT